MNAIYNKWSKKLGLVSFLAIGVVLAWGIDGASAQITPDNTMGTGNSTVTSTGTVDAINGGATRGANLFHSFQEFNVNEGRAAVFTNPAGIENILTRVTGANPSNILGTLGVAGGNANLFLINPNGIIFGANARLNVGGSFVATTANGIGFGDRGVFSATNPNTPGLLTVNPSAFFFNQIAAAPIQNNSVAPSGLNPSSEFTAEGLRVPDGKSLLLVGGDIDMNGGGLFAFGGRVELGGLASAGTIGLNGGGDNLSLSFPDGVERSDIFLSNGAQVNVTASDIGSIAVNARNLEITDKSGLRAGIATGLGNEQSQAGNIEVEATGVINLNNESFIANRVQREAKGQGGNISVSAGTLRLKGGAQVRTITFSSGQGGNLRVDAQDVQLIGESADGQLGSALITSAQRNTTGDAGDLNLQTNTLRLEGGAQVSAITFGSGQGGNLRVDAQDVQLIGRSADDRIGSALDSSAQQNSTGDAGDLTVNTNTLRVQDGAQVSASTFGSGKGGSLTVNATNVQLIGRSADGQIGSALITFAAQQNSTGDAGDLTVNTNTLRVQDGAEINVQSRGTGSAGNMTLNARSIRLDNNGLLTGDTRSTKVDPNSEQATINISSQNLFMSRNSNIFTNAEGENVIGGNINIDTDFLIAAENSDISANSANFRGGNVRIDAFGIFGTQFRDRADDRTSDITASGSSPEFSGSVELDQPDIDPNSGLVNLPSVPVDTQVAQNCTPSGTQNQSEFIVTGRGGLPPNPTQVLSSDAISLDWVALSPTIENRSSPNSATNSTVPSPAPIVEASGWVIDRQGEVILTASTVPVAPHNSWQSSAECNPSTTGKK